MSTGAIHLRCLDVFGKFIGERVDIVLRNHELQSASRRVQDRRADRLLKIGGLRADTQNLFLVQVTAPSYKMVSRLVSVSSSTPKELTLTLPVNPDKVFSVNFPQFAAVLADGRALMERSTAVLGLEGSTGMQLYDALPDLSRAGLLNICAKTNRTRLHNGQTVLSQLEQLLEIRGDRFFCRVPQSLREQTKNSSQAGLFTRVSGLLHHPPTGFELVDSWKTPDAAGNLQMTFFTNGTEWRADVDIDDANGFAHFTQVVNNFFTGPTHPYNIHQILIATQELDPAYRFVLGEGGSAGAAPA